MKYLALLSVLLPLSLAAPSVVARDTNPYIGRRPAVNKSYATNLEQTIQLFLDQGDELNAARARTVQSVPTFSWVSNIASIANIKPLITDALAQQAETGEKTLVQIVIYNLPDRECASRASAGELHLDDDGFNKYKKYIDDITNELSTSDASQLHFTIVLEPDSLGNLVTNLNQKKCANAADAYKQGIAYAIAQLAKPNIDIYIDAGHGGWLGWPANRRPSADIFQVVVDLAQKINPESRVRGLAINVSNYNPFKAEVREPYTGANDAYDEHHYATLLAPHLQAVGFPAHFIVDQSRSGKTGIRDGWGSRCNVKNAGFGARPTADAKVIGNTYVDAFVWVKPGGESDGTSDPNSPRFDPSCALPTSHVPSPEAGEWFNEYAANLVINANPPLEPTY